MKWIIILLFLNLSSCQFLIGKNDGNILKPEKMVDLLAEVHIAEAMALEEKIADVHLKNLIQKAYFQSVLDKNKISKEQFDATVLYYNQHPDLYLELYEKVMIKLTEDEALLNGDKKELKKSLKI